MNNHTIVLILKYLKCTTHRNFIFDKEYTNYYKNVQCYEKCIKKKQQQHKNNCILYCASTQKIKKKIKIQQNWGLI